MTPLALQVLRDAAASDRRTAYSDPDGMVARLREPHCFEVTAAMELAATIWGLDPEALRPTLFLPADQTWIEWRLGTDRSGIFCDRRADGMVDTFRVTRTGSQFAGTFDQASQRIVAVVEEGPLSAILWRSLFVMLAIINTPRLVARREHQPHRGLARQLRQSVQFNALDLRPWTEIQLELTPRLAGGDGPERVTGRKCLHFCRSHIRVQNGRLVVVRPHWRGDAALGVKQSDYRVAA